MVSPSTIFNNFQNKFSWMSLPSLRDKKPKVQRSTTSGSDNSSKPDKHLVLIEGLQKRSIQGDKEAKEVDKLIDVFIKQIGKFKDSPQVDFNAVERSVDRAVILCKRLEAYHVEKEDGYSNLQIRLKRKNIHEMAKSIYSRVSSTKDIWKHDVAIRRLDQEGQELRKTLENDGVKIDTPEVIVPR